MKLPIYLDSHSTTPVDPRVLAAMLPYFSENFGNPSSRQHTYGWTADTAVENARQQLAKLVGAEPNEVIWTSGGTESITTVISGIYKNYSQQKNRIITWATEHKAVLDTLKSLPNADIQILPVDSQGHVIWEHFEKALTDKTLLVCAMMANNEIGTVHDLKKIGTAAKNLGAFVLTDAVQAIGRIPIRFSDDPVDFIAISAHKFYGPKGVGALLVKKQQPRIKIAPLFVGGGQERGTRAGTLNVPGIVGLGAAAELAYSQFNQNVEHERHMQKLIYESLNEIPGIIWNGPKNWSERLSHNLNFTIPNVKSSLLIPTLKDIALSTGSACSSQTMAPSHVLSAIGVPEELALSTLRIGIGRHITAQEAVYAAKSIKSAVEKIRH